MSKEVSIKKNMIMNIILTGSNFLFPLIIYSYVARVLQPEGTGKVAFATSVLTYFSWIAMLGIPAYGVRLCAQVKNNKEELSQCIQELFLINIISTFVAYIFLFSSIFLIPRFKQDSMLFLVISLSIALNTIGMEWVYQALEQYSYITKRSILFKIISLFLVYVFIKSQKDYIIYGTLSIFTTSASYICNFINLRKHVFLKKIKKYNFKRHLRPIFTLFAATIAISLYANFDVVLIGFLKDDASVGMYNAALKIKNVVLSVSVAVTAVLIPRMASYAKNKTNFYNLALKSVRVSLILAMPLAIFVCFNASDILLFISGKDYLSAITTLQILMLCTIVLIFTNFFGCQVLIPLGKEKRYSQSVWIGMVINLALNLALIPQYGSAGAAIGTLVTELFNVVFMSGGAKEIRSFIIKKIGISIYFISLSLAFISLVLAKHFIYVNNVILRLTVYTLAYFIVYYVMLVIKKEPIIRNQLLKIKSKIIKFKLSDAS